jgi:hypothetical protein
MGIHKSVTLFYLKFHKLALDKYYREEVKGTWHLPTLSWGMSWLLWWWESLNAATP